MEELWYAIKRPNLWIMNTEEQYHSKGIENIFHKIIEENFTSLEKEMKSLK